MKFQLMLSKVLQFLGSNPGYGGDGVTDNKFGGTYDKAPEWVNNILKPIFDILTNWLLPVLLILVGFAGTIYIIMLSIKYAKAENADEKDQAKKNLINVVVAVVIMAVALLLIFLFIDNIDLILGWTTRSS